MRKTTIAAAVSTLLTLVAARAGSAPKPPPASVAEQLDRDLTWLERDFVPAAEAMPEAKFDFAPTQGEYKGVRTFAQEVKHVAHTNFVFFAPLVGEPLPANVDPKEENGPDKMKSKAEIIAWLKASFAMGHRAMKSLTASTLMAPLKADNSSWTRLGAATLTVWHSYDHYGQMVEYLRMNGIVPPASRNQP